MARKRSAVTRWRRAIDLPRRTIRRLSELSRYAAPDSALLPGHRIELLINGDQTFTRMLAAIESARSYVHLETYILQPDEIGQRFAEALKKKARQRVKVRVIVDGFGSSGLGWDFVEDLKDAGVEFLWFRPLKIGTPLHRVARRDHRKILVVDGRWSFCGGINIGDNYASGPGGEPGWRDTHLIIRGPVTGELEGLFRDTWLSQGGRRYKPYPLISRDSVAAQAVLAAALPSDHVGQRTLIRRHYLYAIRRAQKSVFLANAYFVPNRGFITALCQAAQRGVDVRILLPAYEHNDLTVVQLASQHCYAPLLEAGVRVFWWPIAHMHAKAAVIDGYWSVVGSYNLDAMSLFQNLEVVVEIIGDEFGDKMVEMFEHDFDRAIELTSETWPDRSTFQQLVEPFAYRLRRLL